VEEEEELERDWPQNGVLGLSAEILLVAILDLDKNSVTFTRGKIQHRLAYDAPAMFFFLLWLLLALNFD